MPAADRVAEALRRVAAARAIARSAADRLRAFVATAPASAPAVTEAQAAAAELETVDVLLADAEARCRRAAGDCAATAGAADDAPPHAWPDGRLGLLAPVRKWLLSGSGAPLRGDLAGDFDDAVRVLGLEAIDLFLSVRPDLPYADAWRAIVNKTHAAKAGRTAPRVAGGREG